MNEKKYILLVDDNPIDLELLSALIESIDNGNKYTCLKAMNASEAITLYGKHCIECAIIDYYMPDNTGAQLLTMLRRLPRYDDVRARLPVIIISGAVDEQMMQRVRETDAMRFIVKDNLKTSEDMQLLISNMLYHEESECAFF